MSKVAVKNLFGTPLNCSWTILKRKYDHVFLIKCIFRRWKGWFWSINWILLWSGGWMHVSWHVDNLLQNFIFQNCNFKINLVKNIFINFNEIFRFWVKYFKLNIKWKLFMRHHSCFCLSKSRLEGFISCTTQTMNYNSFFEIILMMLLSRKKTKFYSWQLEQKCLED